MNKSFWSELWFLMICAFAGVAVTAVATIPMDMFAIFSDVTLSSHIMQWMQTLFIMFIPAILWYSWRFKKDAFTAFGFRNVETKSLLLTLFMMVCALPALDFLSVVNTHIPMPAALTEMADEMRVAEGAALKNLMNVDGVGGFIELVLLMSVGTAVAEETMFRGALLKCFGCTKLNRHWVALLVGLIFSAIHFDVYGFLVRWMLGTLFCYLVFWTGSIWPAILAHAVNNLAALIDYWLNEGLPESPTDLYYSYEWYIYVLSFVVSAAIIWQLMQKCNQK